MPKTLTEAALWPEPTRQAMKGHRGSERLSALLTAAPAQGFLSVLRWAQKPVAQATAVLPSDPHAARPERP